MQEAFVYIEIIIGTSYLFTSSFTPLQILYIIIFCNNFSNWYKQKYSTCYLEIALAAGGGGLRTPYPIDNAQGMRDRYVFILHILVALYHPDRACRVGARI